MLQFGRSQNAKHSTNEEYTDIYFFYCYCTEKCKAAIMETGNNIHLAGLHIAKYLMTNTETGTFPRANAEREQRCCSEDDILKRSSRTSTRTCRISRMIGVAQTQLWLILHHDGFYPCHLQRVQHHLKGITPTVYNFVTGCNHGYVFCVIFC